MKRPIIFISAFLIGLAFFATGTSATGAEKKYSAEVVPENMTVQEKKKRFSALIVPAVEEAYLDLMEQYDEVSKLIKNNKDRERIDALKEEYRATSDEELLAALKPHPKSIAIAQAAMESGWGTSRFFREANNLFGVWSFDKNEPRIAAGEKRGNKTIWVKKYSSIKASIKDYYRVLARGSSYKEFRKLKMKTDDPYLLVKKLDKYSERGAAYAKELSSMIRFNKFYNHDK